MSVPRLLDTSTLSHYFGSRARATTPELVKYVDDLIASDGARISIVTMYEIERGLRKLEVGGGGRTKRRLFAMFMSSTTVYGLDAPQGAGWLVAADIYARASTRSPAIVFGEADLLILATAQMNNLTLVTSDSPFAEHVRALGYGAQLVEVPLA